MDRQEYIENVREKFIYAQRPHWHAYGVLMAQVRDNPRRLIDDSWGAEVKHVHAGIKATCAALRAIDVPGREARLHAFALRVAEREEKAMDLFLEFIQTRQISRMKEAGAEMLRASALLGVVRERFGIKGQV